MNNELYISTALLLTFKMQCAFPSVGLIGCQTSNQIDFLKNAQDEP